MIEVVRHRKIASLAIACAMILSGCGYSIDHLPNLTLLAGWSANNAAVGYIDVGAGRLWLVDVDWQDSQADQSQYTKQLMGYMILNR